MCMETLLLDQLTLSRSLFDILFSEHRGLRNMENLKTTVQRNKLSCFLSVPLFSPTVASFDRLFSFF